jgi:cellobiose-specific phosphotransferase system component IIC
MVKTLIRGACWLAIFAGCCQLLALIGTWTGVITAHTFTRVFERRWYYDNPDDVPEILATAFALLSAGCLGIRFVPRPGGRWVYPIWPERE